MVNREFELFDCVVSRRGRAWRWSISDERGTIVLSGSERNRSAARYMAARAMFQLLLTAPYRLRVNPTDRRIVVQDEQRAKRPSVQK